MKLKTLHHLEDLSLGFHSSFTDSDIHAFFENACESLPSTINVLILIDATKSFSHLARLPYLESFNFGVTKATIIRVCLHESTSYYWKRLKRLEMVEYNLVWTYHQIIKVSKFDIMAHSWRYHPFPFLS